MKLPVLAVAALLVSSSAHADNIVVGCPLIKKYDQSSVNYLLSQARSVIGEQEVGKIYSRYVALKQACQTNSKASGVVPVSATLRNWLSQQGVNIASAGKQL